MSAIGAIVLDTWRQSRQQAVFVVLGVVSLALCIGASLAVGTRTGSDGEDHIVLFGAEESSDLLESFWNGLYVASVTSEPAGTNEGSSGFVDSAGDTLPALTLSAREQAMMAGSSVPAIQRGAEVYAYWTANILYTLSMWLFIIACSGYFPAMLEGGAIDMVLAKPLRRWKIYLGKYLGGLGLFSMLMLISYSLVFLGLGFRSGVWVFGVLAVLPLQIMVAALLYAMIAVFGVHTRSPLLSTVVGLALYIVVDTGMGALLAAQKSGVFARMGWGGLDKIAELYPILMPNFTLLKEQALLSTLNVPLMTWPPFATAFVWIVASLGLGCWRFSRTDY